MPVLTPVSLALLLTTAASSPGAASGGGGGLFAELRAKFDRSPAKAKAMAACTDKWQERGAATPQGRRYTVLSCESPFRELYLDHDDVFAVGIRIADKIDEMKARGLFKDGRADLEAARCTLTADRGQMLVYECADGFAATLLNNWDSRTDTHTVSALIGRANAFLPLIGLKPKAR